MAPTLLQFGIGMAVATLGHAPRLARAWRAAQPLAAPLGRWMLWSWGLGAFAIVPNLLRTLGLPDAAAQHGAMNIFLLNPLVGSLRPGDSLRGLILVAAMAGLQYLVLLAAIRRAR